MGTGTTKVTMMKQPLWLLNSSLLLLFLCAWIAALLLEESPVKPASIQPQSEPVASDQETPKVSIARIYENDVFGTYVPQPEPDVTKPEAPQQPPQPPQPQPAPSTSQSEPSFLAPLEVTLKGVIFTNEEAKTRAIIADNTTQEEALYQVGDPIKDADIVHIGKQKVILVRSNGQQETLFITEQHAQKDPGHPKNSTTWSNVVEQTNQESYTVHLDQFLQAVPHLAHFLDALDMTTAFENGQAVGARIGNIGNDSLGTALGLQSGDIITHIDGTETNTTHNRVNIYQNIINKGAEDTITATIQRGTTSVKRTYMLHRPRPQSQQAPATLPSDNPIRDKKTTNKAIMKNGSKQKETVDTLQKPNMKSMLRRGEQENALQRTQ